MVLKGVICAEVPLKNYSLTPPASYAAVTTATRLRFDGRSTAHRR